MSWSWEPNDIWIQISALPGFEPRTSHLAVQHATARPLHPPYDVICNCYIALHTWNPPILVHR